MITDLTIYPISGFGELEFYMSPLEVSTLLGSPNDTEKDEDDIFFIWQYSKQGLFLSFEKEADYTLTVIYFEKKSNANFIGTPLFSHSPSSLIDLIHSVEHVIIEDEPSDDYPTILVSPSLTMTFFFNSDDSLEAMSFEAPPKENVTQETDTTTLPSLDLNL